MRLMNAIVFICLALLPVSVYGNGLQVNATFGGALHDSDTTVLSDSWDGGSSASYCFAIQLIGPEFQRLRPIVSFDRLWGGDVDLAHIESHSNVFSAGLGWSVPVGHSVVSPYLCVSLYDEGLTVHLESDDERDFDRSELGGVAGVNLQFRFFDQLDSIVGYKVYMRESFVVSDEMSGGIYQVDGWGTAHCFSFGLGWSFGGV